MSRAWLKSPLLVGVVGLVLASGLAVRILSDLDWDATAFIGFGEGAAASRAYAERELGEVYLRPASGHDGKFFFVQANDPWVSDPSGRDAMFDFPVHRSRRMLYPTVAGGFGLFGPGVVVWSLLITNVIWMGIGTWGTASLARSLGGSGWWGLAFALNIGLIFSLVIDGAGILALATAVWAVALLYKGSLAWGTALLAASALTRETMILCALGVGIWLWTNHRRRGAVLTWLVPAAVLGSWEIYLRSRLGPDPEVPGSLGLPFRGMVAALSDWLGDPVAFGLAACLVLITLLYVRRWWVSRSLLSWAFVGFIPLGAVLTAAIWTELFDFTRAMAPLLTPAILVLFVDRPDNPAVPAAPVGAHRSGRASPLLDGGQ